MPETILPDAIELTKALIAAESVTPARGSVFDVLEAALLPLGFKVERFIEGEAPEGPVENLLAVRGTSGRHFAFAGHLDVVPPGQGWTSGAFEPEVRGGLLYGRGAVDMKGAIAAFVAAAARVEGGVTTLIITGDEEGPATYGTPRLIERMAERGLLPDLCLVGEPTSQHRLGDMIKIGRRGSTVIDIVVPGKQGHVAYPHLADNPVPRLVRALAEIDAITLDQGNAWFQPSNIEIIDLTVGNPATNVIPGEARARISIRFNDQQYGPDLIARIEEIVQSHAPAGIVKGRVYGEAFLTEPGELSTLISGAIRDRLGVETELSTTGGTSDARFLSKLCPVVEFGLLNATMHKLDEAVALPDLVALTDVYAEILKRAFA
ncbi:succinyl-diaminopimelate desuccinylase [Sphingomonas kyeonggiensis]|uniref:Succinyl-diaminopimelate desuccinylase n=1 Tax=Sphingomonas kyeonggiensis TaxID=1268553 RepID=A0A7W6JR44_9SPHN|nr:succinyl-diaminopimelate desuccinylase [Sphingomonas kyeonggiensis]MBB4096950.1 succinyl-diaminopimelate desuccinylase [Sphingomonas kyeonggiensis]